MAGWLIGPAVGDIGIDCWISNAPCGATGRRHPIDRVIHGFKCSLAVGAAGITINAPPAIARGMAIQSGTTQSSFAGESSSMLWSEAWTAAERHPRSILGDIFDHPDGGFEPISHNS
jgi:hypothetical protein